MASPSKTPGRTLSRQHSSPSLNLGLPPPIPSSPSLTMALTSSASSRSLRSTNGSPTKARRSPRIRRGDVESSATSASESEIEPSESLFTSRVKASPSVRLGMADVQELTPKRKVAGPIEPMTVGRKKREALAERLARAAAHGEGGDKQVKKSRSHADVGMASSGSTGDISLMTAAHGVMKEKDGGKDKVVVCVRIKPTTSAFMQTAYELTSTSLALSAQHPNVVKRGGKIGREAEYSYPVDMLLKQPATTPSLYNAKIAPLVEKAMNGFNSTIFAYGQTGSGKSFTMTGNKEELGVIPCAVDGVFDAITADRDRAFLLRVSYVEIYNETLRDLLNFDKGQKETPVIHSGKGKVYVSPLVEEIVATPQDVMKLLSRGNEGRKIGATDWNERSSRSHCVFTIIIESRPRETSGKQTGTEGDIIEEDEDIRLSRLNLIDLAGSEKAVTDVERRGEGKHINQSLLALREVINKLTEKKRSHIPYRNSKLTHLLENALGGDSNICVICTMSAEEEHTAETLETLKFAGRCSQVETKATKNVLPSSEKALIRAKDAEIEELKKKLKGLVRGGGSGVSGTDLMADGQAVELAESVAEMEERKKRLKVQLAKLNGEILTSELPRLNGNVPMSPAKPKRRRISEFLGARRPQTPTSHRRAVSGRAAIQEEETPPQDLFADRTATSLKQALVTKDAEIARLRTALAAAQSSHSSTSSNLLDSAHTLEQTRNELAANIEDKQAKINSLEDIILDLRKSREDILIEDQSRLDEVQRRLDMANADLQRVAREATGDLPTDLEREKEAFKRDLEQVNQSHEVELKRYKAEMSKLRAQLKDRWSVAEGAEMKADEMERQSKVWQAEVEKCREAVERYDAAKAGIACLQDELKELKDRAKRVDFLEAANTALQAEVSRIEGELQALQMTSGTSTTRIAELEDLVDELRSERMEAVAKVADFELDMVSLKENAENKERELLRATDDLEKRTEQLAQRDVEYQVSREKMGKEIEGLQRDKTSLENDFQELKGAVESARAEVEQKDREVQEKTKLAEEGEQKLAEAITALANARQGAEGMSEMQAKLEQTTAEMAKALERIDESEKALASVRAELESANLDGADSKIKLEEARSIHADLQTAHTALKSQLDTSQAAKRDLEAALSDAKAQQVTLTDEVEQVRSTGGANDAMLAQLRADVELAQTKTQELKDAKAALEAERAVMRESIFVLEQAQAELLSTETSLRAEVEAVRTAKDQADLERAAAMDGKALLQKELDDSRKRQTDIENELERVKLSSVNDAEAVEKLRKELNTVNDKVEKMQTASAALEAALHGKDSTIMELKQKLESSANDHASASATMTADLTALQQAHASTTSEADRIRNMHVEAEKRSADLEVELHAMRTAASEGNAKMQQLKSEVDALTKQLEAKVVEVSDLADRLEKERLAKADQQQEEGEQSRQLREEIERLSAELTSGLSESTKLRDEREGLERALMAGGERLKELEGILKIQAQERTAEGAKVLEAETTMAAMRKERDVALERVMRESKDVAQLREEAGKMKAEVSALQVALEESRAAVAEAQEHKSDAENQVDALTEEHRDTERTLSQLRNKVDELQRSLVASVAEKTQTEGKRVEAETRLADLVAELEGVRLAQAKADQDRSAALGQLSELEARHAVDSAELARLRSDTDRLSTRLAETESQLSASKAIGADLEKEITILREAAAANAQKLERKTSRDLRNTLPTVHSGLPNAHSPSAPTDGMKQSPSMTALIVRHREEIGHLEEVIKKQEETIEEQRRKIVFWSNELEKQREVVRLLTSSSDSPTRLTISGAGTRHIKAHSISDSPSRSSPRTSLTNGGGKDDTSTAAAGTVTSGLKKGLPGTFTARNLALPSAPTPLPMHSGQYANTSLRKNRRVTIDHDMESLNESKKIAQAKAIFDAPATPEKVPVSTSTIRGVVLGNTPKQREPWRGASARGL